MQLLFLFHWISDEMLKAMCWILVHSLWQGLLAAAVAGMIIISTKKTSARLRYNLLGSLLVLFLLTVAFTARQQIGSIDFGSTAANRLPVENNAVFIASDQQAQVNVTTNGSAEKLIQFMNDHADFIMLVWALCFFFNCAKICTGIAGIHRLRTRRIHAAEGWQTKLNYLSRVIGINQPVKLLQSELVRVPVAIGFFKPVILVPLGLLSHLPPDQVETILLHELAHIRRRDYLVNILQRFAEAVFFFNPALLWISSLIRQEREACCDDIVVANTSHKGSYLEALVSFQEYSLNTPAYAMGISSKKHYLLNRVKRMLTRENKKLDLMEKIFLIIGVTVVSAFTFMPKNDAAVQQLQQQPVRQSIKRTEEKTTDGTGLTTPSSAIVNSRVQARRAMPVKETVKPPFPPPPVKDTVPPKNEQSQTSSASNSNDEINFKSRSATITDDGKTRTSTITVLDKSGKKYSISRVNDKITNLSVDGNTIPESEYEKYSSLIGQMDRGDGKRKAKSEEEMKKRNEEMMKRNEERKARIDEDVKRRKEETVRNNEERKAKMGEERNKNKEELNKQKSLNDIEFHKKMEKFEKDNEKMKKENEKRKEDFEKRRKEIDRKMEERRKEIDKDRERLYKEMEKERKKNQEEMKRERERRQKEIEKDRKEAEEERKKNKKESDSKDRGSNIFRKGKKTLLINGKEVVMNQNGNSNEENKTQKTIANNKDLVMAVAPSDTKEAIKRRNDLQLFAKTEIHNAVFKKDILKNNTFRLTSNMQLKPRTNLNFELKNTRSQDPQPKRLANPRKPVTLVTPAKDADKSSPGAPGGKDPKKMKYAPRVQKPLVFNVT